MGIKYFGGARDFVSGLGNIPFDRIVRIAKRVNTEQIRY